MKDRVEIIARTKRHRKFSDAEKAAILAEADERAASMLSLLETAKLNGVNPQE